MSLTSSEPSVEALFERARALALQFDSSEVVVVYTADGWQAKVGRVSVCCLTLRLALSTLIEEASEDAKYMAIRGKSAAERFAFEGVRS